MSVWAENMVRAKTRAQCHLYDFLYVWTERAFTLVVRCRGVRPGPQVRMPRGGSGSEGWPGGWLRRWIEWTPGIDWIWRKQLRRQEWLLKGNQATCSSSLPPWEPGGRYEDHGPFIKVVLCLTKAWARRFSESLEIAHLPSSDHPYFLCELV